MVKVGLTGGIGCGKSTVSQMLKDSGFPIIDADIISKDVLKKYPEILEKVRIEFGDNFFDWRGEFRRREFGNHIFRFAKERMKYEALIMPYIFSDIEEEFKKYENNNEKVIILDAPTLIENNMHKNMDIVILVTADRNTQIERIKSRDKLTEYEIVNRMNSQMSLDNKKKFANIVINNNESLSKTKEIVDEVIELLNLYKL